MSQPAASVSYAIAIAQGVRFYSRLRIPRLPGETDPFAPPDGQRMARMLPVSAILILLPALLTFWLAMSVGLPPLIIATLGVITLVMTTGAFHEDGLADTADGFGGGATRERRLEIMKDSRVGTFGAAALCLGLVLRIGALMHVQSHYSAGPVLSIIVAAGIISRVAGLVPLGLLPSARSDGAGAAVGMPTRATLAIAYGLAAILSSGAAFIAGWGTMLLAAMLIFSVLAAVTMAWLSHRMIQGQTGDVAGATQQIVEAGCYILPLMTIFRG